jgi:nitrite reductase/ring-hydroxylating ferredoxin subunit
MTHPATTECDTRTCSFDRRGVLLAAGLAATATALAGCGGDGAGSKPADAAPPAKDPAEGALPVGPDVPAGALTTVSEVPVGGGVAVNDGKIVVAQPTGGVFKAYDARCPHQGVEVDPPDAAGMLKCPGHRARFRVADGSVVDGPADRGLSAIPVKVAGKYVVRAA